MRTSLKSAYPCLYTLVRRVRLCVAGTVAFSAVVPSFAQSGGPQNAAGITLRLEHTIAGPPEAVFLAWIAPEAIRKWFVYKVAAHWDPDPTVDAKPAGRFAFSIIRDRDGAQFRFHGSYRELKPVQKLAFTWEWDSIPIPGIDGPGDTLVSIEFLNLGTVTNVVLTQSNLPSEAARDAHRDGWYRCLDGIANVLNSGQQTANSKEDSVIVKGDLSSNIKAIENVEMVFKDGVGYDSKKLIESVKGQVGIR